MHKKRASSRIDVYMDYLKEFCGKEVYDITDNNVLDYLVHKDVNNSGRTVVQNRARPFLESDSFLQCKDPVLCAHRHAAHSMRIGIILKLRKPSRKWDEQGLTMLQNRNAPYMTRTKMDILMKCFQTQLQNIKGLSQLKIAQRIAMYAYYYAYIKRLAGCNWCKAPKTIRMPKNRGLSSKLPRIKA